jgi:hypothetical protein
MATKKDAKGFWQLGKVYFVRSVTYHYVGRLKEINDKELVLSDCAWVADSGRWTQAMVDGTLSEVEPYPNDVMVARTAIVDATEWKHDLPLKQQ